MLKSGVNLQEQVCKINMSNKLVARQQHIVYPGYSDQLTDQLPDFLPQFLHHGALGLGLYLHDAGVLYT